MKANVIQVFPFNIDKIKLLTLRGPKGETGYPTPEQVQTAVDAWLDDHPEATTTVQDGAITTVKLHDGAVTEDKLSESLQSLLITDTASGSIASFSDGSDGLNLRDLKVNVEPSQDLHGYSNPWPAGGGKNKFPFPTSAETKNGVTVEATADGEIWVHGTPTIASGYITFNMPAISPSVVGNTVTISVNEKIVGVGVQSGAAGGSTNLTMGETTTSKTGVYGSVSTNPQITVRYDVGTIDKKFKVQLELGSSVTAWNPYSNICPITGWENVVVTRAGRNIIENQGAATSTPRSVTVTKNADGSVTLNGTVTGGAMYYKMGGGYFADAVPIPRWLYGKQLTMSGGTSEVAIMFTTYNASGTATNHFSTTSPATFTIAEDQKYFGYFLNSSNGRVINNVTVYPQIEVGSSASSYEPYTAAEVTIPLGSTVYGGTLDVTSGVLTVDRAIITIDSLATGTIYNITGYQSVFTQANGVMALRVTANSSVFNAIEKSGNGAGISTHFLKGFSWNNLSSAGKFGWVDGFAMAAHYSAFGFASWDNGMSVLTDAQKSALATALTGCVFTWELATPTTVQLTPQQVTTLLGQNNIFADCGNVEVDYVADTKLYIAKMIANALNA